MIQLLLVSALADLDPADSSSSFADDRSAAWRRASVSGAALSAAVEQHRRRVREQAPAVLGQLEASARSKVIGLSEQSGEVLLLGRRCCVDRGPWCWVELLVLRAHGRAVQPAHTLTLFRFCCGCNNAPQIARSVAATGGSASPAARLHCSSCSTALSSR